MDNNLSFEQKGLPIIHRYQLCACCSGFRHDLKEPYRKPEFPAEDFNSLSCRKGAVQNSRNKLEGSYRKK